MRAQNIHFAAIAWLSAMLFASAARASVCEVHRRPLVIAADADVDMIVKSGKDCRVRYPADEGFEPVKGEIMERPHYGGARMSERFDVFYRSNPRYKGPDRFSFMLCGVSGAKQGCSEVRVKVNVR